MYSSDARGGHLALSVLSASAIGFSVYGNRQRESEKKEEKENRIEKASRSLFG